MKRQKLHTKQHTHNNHQSCSVSHANGRRVVLAPNVTLLSICVCICARAASKQEELSAQTDNFFILCSLCASVTRCYSYGSHFARVCQLNSLERANTQSAPLATSIDSHSLQSLICALTTHTHVSHLSPSLTLLSLVPSSRTQMQTILSCVVCVR